MAAYWPFWNLFQLYFFLFPLRHVISEKQWCQSEMYVVVVFFFFFWSSFVFGCHVWSLAAAKPCWFSDCGGLQRLLASQWWVFVFEILFLLQRHNVGVLFGSCVHARSVCALFPTTCVLLESAVISRATKDISFFFFFLLVFLRREEKLWGRAEKSRSVLKLQVDEAGLEHLSFYPRHRFIKKNSSQNGLVSAFFFFQNKNGWLCEVCCLFGCRLRATFSFISSFSHLLWENNKTVQ